MRRADFVHELTIALVHSRASGEPFEVTTYIRAAQASARHMAEVGEPFDAENGTEDFRLPERWPIGADGVAQSPRLTALLAAVDEALGAMKGVIDVKAPGSASKAFERLIAAEVGLDETRGVFR